MLSLNFLYFPIIMLMTDVKKMKLNGRRAELVNNTSLEILKQKKTGGAARVRGQFFSKQFVSSSVNEVLRSKNTFIVALKGVDVFGGRTFTLYGLQERGLSVSTILSVPNIKTLYVSLSANHGLTWLLPHLTSNSTFLLVMNTFEDYLAVVKYCIGVEATATSEFYEILFLKESTHFINFSLNTNRQEALALRKLYSQQTLNNILLELNSCIAGVSASFTGIFSISLMNPSCAIYRDRI